MKKFISVAVAVMMLFAVSAPAFATTSSYLPDSTATTGNRTLFAIDFDDATELSSAIKTTYSSLTDNSGTSSPSLVTEPVKGGQSMLVTDGTTWDGIGLSSGDGLALESGQKLYYELSFMMTDHSEDRGNIVLQAGSVPIRVLSINNPGPNNKDTNYLLDLTNESQVHLNYELNKWYHLVMKITPGTSSANSSIALYINGELYGTYNNSNYSLTGFSTFSKSRLQVSAVADEKIYIDDFKSWISTADYDPSAAGDIVEVTSTDFKIEDGVITYENVSTLGELYEKLSVTADAGIAFIDANGDAIEDPETKISEGVQFVARSKSGAVVKAYKVKAKEPPALTSTVYTVDDDAKTISGVPFMTKVNDFKAGLTTADGKTLTVSSANGYADSATTVTVDGTAYTVVNKSYVWHEFGTYTLGGLANANISISASTDTRNVSSTNDVLKGGSAILSKAEKDGQVLHASVPTALIPALEEGDVVNLEFNIKADGYHRSQAGYRDCADAVAFTEDGKITVLKQYDSGITYVPGEWYHIVMSYKYKHLSSKYHTFKLYINGQEIQNPDRSDALFPHSNMDIVSLCRVSLSGAVGVSLRLDDFKVYKAATQNYDEAYMTGNQLVTSDSYVVDGKTVYVPADDVAGAIYALNFPVDPVDASGNVIDPDSMEIGDVFYIKEGTSDKDTDASRVSKYTLAEANVLTASGDKVSAAFNGNGMIIGAAYDANGKVTATKVFNVDMEKATADLSSLEGATVKAYLWSDLLKPYSVLTKGADGEWK